MLHELMKILRNLLGLYAIQRFPDVEDWKNPHMMARVFVPLLLEMGWLMSIDREGKVTLYYQDTDVTDRTREIVWLESGESIEGGDA